MRDGVGRHDPGVAAAALDRQPRCAVLGLLELFRNDPFLHPSHRVHLVKVNLEAAGPRTRRRPRDAPHHQLARPRPAQRPWLAPQDSDLAHLDAGLLHHLPRRGLLQGLALLDEARKASQHPARGVTGRPKQRVVAVRGDHQADGHRVQPRVLLLATARALPARAHLSGPHGTATAARAKSHASGPVGKREGVPRPTDARRALPRIKEVGVFLDVRPELAEGGGL
mmetsp:Transcript_3280/g.11478  ORF Transcript_3280/g.11478 Transcript_3280/m.11478 type:complete len:225 (+) Transcript_3280:2164-2838(+)